MQEIDTWRAAQQMRKMFGPDAAVQSAMRADKLLDQGDIAGFQAWKRITAAVNELDRTKPDLGEAQH